MEYMFLNTENEQAILASVLEDLERTHYTLSVQIKELQADKTDPETDASERTDIQTRIDQLQARRRKIGMRHDSLKQDYTPPE